MITLLTILHVIVCIFLCFVVLLQQGKGADLSGAFGGGGTQTAFGARSGATLLTKATTAAAILFMLTSLTLTILVSRPGSSSVIREGATPPAQEQPAPPAETPAPAPEQAPANPPAPSPDQK